MVEQIEFLILEQQNICGVASSTIEYVPLIKLLYRSHTNDLIQRCYIYS
jgi:hypothetical protein